MKYKYGIGVGLVLVVVLALILWPSQLDLDRLREMYERGQYEAVYTQLERELMQKPHWHEARELLILSAMEAGRVDLALIHLAELVGAGESGEILEGQLDLWLSDNLPALKHADAAVEAARAGVEGNRDWSWIGNYYLGLLVRLERAEEIPGALEVVLAANGQSYAPHFAEAWRLVAEKSQFDDLWQISATLDSHSYNSWREYAVAEIDDWDKLQILQEQHHRDPILAAALALCHEQNGMDFLNDWEKANTVDDNCSDYYSAAKGRLLTEADEISPEDFAFVRPAHILQAAVESIDQESKLAILDWLEEQGHYVQEVSEIRGAGRFEPILSLQAPFLSYSEQIKFWFWEELNHSPLSPDGICLGISTHEGVKINHLENSSEAHLQGFNRLTVWWWDQDSKRVAVTDGHSIEIFSSQGELVDKIELEAEVLYPLGWQGKDKLWIQAWMGSPANPGRPILYDVESGEAQTSSYREVFPCPSGNLAWGGGRGEIVFQKGEKITKLPQFLKFISWLPDGSGLLLEGDNKLQLWVDEQQDLGLRGKFLGWRDAEEFYWAEGRSSGGMIPAGPLGPGLSRLKSYNITTGEVKDYNLPGFWETAWADKAISRGLRIAAYRLP